MQETRQPARLPCCGLARCPGDAAPNAAPPRLQGTARATAASVARDPAPRTGPHGTAWMVGQATRRSSHPPLPGTPAASTAPAPWHAPWRGCSHEAGTSRWRCNHRASRKSRRGAQVCRARNRTGIGLRRARSRVWSQPPARRLHTCWRGGLRRCEPASRRTNGATTPLHPRCRKAPQRAEGCHHWQPARPPLRGARARGSA
mmetsp:Transcript_59505/g.191474  ORF Transcript_59505/g.191474 Transcript_59505/m.191474 type:complete len:202 (-) Transcript_59505:1209-1814(-)